MATLSAKMTFFLRRAATKQTFLTVSKKSVSTTVPLRSQPLAAPEYDGAAKNYSPKIQSLVDQIAQLNLLEVSDLNDLLRKTLNIKDVPMGGFAVAAPQAAPAEAEEEAEVKPTKSSFRLKLVSFDAAKKVTLIKEIKSLGENMNLVQAKKFVESMPQVYRDNIGKDEAEKLKEQLEKCGATCEIE